MSESLTDQVSGILKVRVTSIQKLDTGFSGGILKFQTLVSQWDTEKKCQFQTLMLYYDCHGNKLVSIPLNFQNKIICILFSAKHFQVDTGGVNCH